MEDKELILHAFLLVAEVNENSEDVLVNNELLEDVELCLKKWLVMNYNRINISKKDINDEQ